MEHVRWSTEPELHRPVVITAFEGWNDAGDAASTAVRFLADRWRARPFASIDAEAFYDFTTNRPQVRLDDDGQRSIVWPRNRLLCTKVPNLGDVILLDGTEPALMWRTFTKQVIGLARRFDASMVVTFGALISDVPHSRPVEVHGSSSDAELAERFEFEPSTYEGPTGIVGVMQNELREAGIRCASLWAAVPSYVHGAPSPKAALALVEKLAEMLDVGLTTTDLQIATAAYERQVNTLVSDDADTADLVRQLEERYDELANPASLVEEVEQFLRDATEE
jgi:predicted ATP-grasp superfamily ATP-dependent carboligase